MNLCHRHTAPCLKTLQILLLPKELESYFLRDMGVLWQCHHIIPGVPKCRVNLFSTLGHDPEMCYYLALCRPPSDALLNLSGKFTLLRIYSYRRSLQDSLQLGLIFQKSEYCKIVITVFVKLHSRYIILCTTLLEGKGIWNYMSFQNEQVLPSEALGCGSTILRQACRFSSAGHRWDVDRERKAESWQ